MADKADKSTVPMGRRQKARIAQRRRRRLIAAGIFILLCLIVIFIVWMSRESNTNSNGNETVIISSVTEMDEGLTAQEYSPEDTELSEDTDSPETSAVEETEAPEETETVRETESAQETETSKTLQTAGSGTTGTASKGSTGTTKTDTTSKVSTSTSTKTNTSNTTNTNTNNKTTETVTLKSGTLSCTVTSATQGSQANLTWKALDSKGNDITSKCTITYSVTNCTVKGNTVTFRNVGTASVTGTITYNGSQVTTNAISVKVAAQPAVTTTPDPVVLTAASLSCTADTAKQGESAELAVTALDAAGKDITSDCTIIYTSVGCTVEGNTVTFDTLGTAEITAKVTYQDVTLTTETVSVAVTGPLAAVTLTYTPDNSVKTTVSVGDTATLSVKAVDVNGAELSGCTVTYTATNATVEENKVTFDHQGKVTITATALLDGVTVTSGPVTVYVDFQVILTKAGNITVVMGQHVTNERFGWYICLPTLATKVTEKDADGNEVVNDSLAVYNYKLLDMTVSIVSEDREESDTATVEELYSARTEALTAEGAQILAGKKSTETGYYQITWQKDATVTTEYCYVGSASESTLIATYPAENREGAEQLFAIIASTFQEGNLNVTHPAK